MTPKAVFIDFDGTLVDSLPSLFSFYLEFMKSFNLSGSKEEFSRLNGFSLPEMVAYLNRRYEFNLSKEELHQLYKERVVRLYQTHIQLFPGVEGCLSYLKSRAIRLGIVTSAPFQLVSSFLEKRKLAGYFEHLVTSEGLSKGKPDPEIYLKALHLYGIEAKKSIAIEDSVNGVQSALQAGIPTIQLLTEDSPNFQAEGALQATVGSWSEILSLFDRACMQR